MPHKITHLLGHLIIECRKLKYCYNFEKNLFYEDLKDVITELFFDNYQKKVFFKHKDIFYHESSTGTMYLGCSSCSLGYIIRIDMDDLKRGDKVPAKIEIRSQVAERFCGCMIK